MMRLMMIMMMRMMITMMRTMVVMMIIFGLLNWKPAVQVIFGLWK